MDEQKKSLCWCLDEQVAGSSVEAEGFGVGKEGVGGAEGAVVMVEVRFLCSFGSLSYCLSSFGSFYMQICDVLGAKTDKIVPI